MTEQLTDITEAVGKVKLPMIRRIVNGAPVKDLGVLKNVVYEDPRVAEYSKRTNSLRTYVKSAYAIQSHRIALGNRICATFRYKLGLEPSQKETDDAQAHKILKLLRDEYSTIMEGVIEMPTNAAFFKNKEGNITQIAELFLIQQYTELVRMERNQFDALEALLQEFPVYTEFLSKIHGVGPAMAAILVSEINIYKTKYPSSIERLMGIDTVRVVNLDTGEEQDEGRSNRKAHLVTREYIDKEGNTKTKLSITYNPFLKTKIMGVLAPIFIKLGKRIDKETGAITYKNDYAPVFDNYKARIYNRNDGKYRTPIHIRNMAMRYMVKAFIQDLYKNWRRLEGLPVHPTYAVGKLGHNEHNSPSTT